MAIQTAASIVFLIVGDGTSTIYDFDLDTHPYWVAPIGNQGIQPTNWFSGDRKFAAPVAVLTSSLGTATISGNVLHLAFSTPPTSGVETVVNVTLIFA